MQRLLQASLLIVCVAGCATAGRMTTVAGLPEDMCRHCNCLMPAGTDPQKTCPVCECKKLAGLCVRGGH